MIHAKTISSVASFPSRIIDNLLDALAALALLAHQTGDLEDSYAYGAPIPTESHRAV